MNRVSLVRRKLQSVKPSMGEKPAIVREEMVNAPYETAGVVTDGALIKWHSCERGRSQVLRLVTLNGSL
ncbi:MAG: hypothetical protein NC238_15325 [Dehalobacter sp.]|nr:hypothetical protein [Dehalobacter sp.]